MENTPKEVVKLITLQKTHLTIYILVALLTPIGTAWTAYQSAVRASGKVEIEKQFVELKLEYERHFVKKDKFEALERMVNQIAVDVSYLRGRAEKSK